jgi:hypothetical protein
MVRIIAGDAGSTTTSVTGLTSPSVIAPGASFELSNAEMVFAPLFYPSEIVVSKERRHSRQDNFCAGEDVSDIGSKNRELHIAGKIRANETAAFNTLLDQHQPLDLLCDEWSGEVVIESGEYKRFALDVYEYKLNVVSTGANEAARLSENGIIKGGYAGRKYDHEATPEGV